MKSLWAILIIAAFFLYPIEGTEVGSLRPMEVLVATVEDGDVVVTGGEGLIGRGGSWYLALSNLEATASGTPFFGTVSAVVLGDSALLPQLLEEPRLRPAAEVYYGGGDPEDLSAYFADAEGGTTIQVLKTAALQGGYVRVPTITATEGGFVIG